MLATLQEALATMEAALYLLDQAEAPAEIGAHLDLAICKLQKVIGAPASSQQELRGTVLSRLKSGAKLRA